MTRTSAKLTRPALVMTAAAVLLTASACRRSTDEPPVSLESQLAVLSNVAEFAEPPNGVARLDSSYDRTGGNSDWAQNERPDEDGLITIARLEGPGCVTRIWLTGQQIDDWLFFLDGESEPRIHGIRRDEPEGPDDILHAFQPPLHDHASGGRFVYTPIPFRESLRIAVAPDAKERGRPYHQINYTTYPSGTSVRSFPRTLDESQREAIRQAAAAWRGVDASLAASAAAAKPQGQVTVAPGAAHTWLSDDSAGTVRCFWFEVEPAEAVTAVQRARLLRQLSLRIYWNGNDEPSVNVPFGDFFGNAFHRRRYSSIGLGYLGGRFVCRFPMPFDGGCRGELVNNAAFPVTVTCGVDRASRTSAGGAGRYFHAEWRQTDSPSRPPGHPHFVMGAKGPGHMVGCYLNAIATDQSWYILEGDERISVTGSDARSLHGTGLEDYFNGAWYYNGLSDLPFSGLLEKAAMCTDQYRMHLADRIGFEDRIGFTFEFGHGNASRGYLSSTAFWYADAAAAVQALPPSSRRFPAQRPMEPVVLILALIELDRQGLYEEALERSLYYAERYAGQELGEIMHLRALAYRDLLGQRETAVEGYRTVLAGKLESYLKKQAAELLALHENPANVLIAAQGHCRFDLYLDGERVLAGADSRPLYTAVRELGGGEHELAVKIYGPMPPDAWFNAYVRTHDRCLRFDSLWEHADGAEPPAWPSTEGEDVTWERNPETGHGRPRYSTWVYVPNAYAGAQADEILRTGRLRWTRDKRAAAYLRRRFNRDGIDGALRRTGAWRSSEAFDAALLPTE